MSTPSVLEDDKWSEDAVATIIALALSHDVFDADDLRREMRRPPHSSMAGAAFSAASTKGYIKRVSDKTSTAKSRNHSLIRTWQATPLLEAIARRQS